MEADGAGLARDAVATLHAVETAVLDFHIADLRTVLETRDEDTIARTLAGDVLHDDVPDRGRVVATALLARFIVEVDLEHGLAALTDTDVAHVYAFDHAAPTCIRLDAQHAFQGRRIHLAVVGKDVATAATYLRPNDHAAVSVLHHTTADDDVLAGHVTQPSVAVAPALDGYAVVACVEEAVLDEHAVARLRVASVAVRSVVLEMNILHMNVGTLQRMQHPEGGAQQGDALNAYALALVQTDELGTHAVGKSESAQGIALSGFVAHRHSVLAILQQTLATTLTLTHDARLPPITFRTAPRPPRFPRATAVDSAFTRDSDVRRLEGIDARRKVVAVETFPRRFDDGVDLGLEGKAKDSPFLDDQTDARFELDGSSEECLSGRYDDTATALARTAVDGSLYGSLVVGGCGRRLCTQASDDYGVRAEARRLNALFDVTIERVVPLTGEGEQRRQAEQKGKKKVSGHRW